GSIRIPAAFCGAVGLKATWGRISEAGAFPLCWSVAHVGPIAASAADCLLAYAVMAGPDPKDPHTALQPPLSDPTTWGSAGIDGMKIGIFRPWFEDADPDVVRSCSVLLEAFEKQGARVVEIEIPDLDLARVAHLVTIVSEMATSIEPHYPAHRFDFGLDVRSNLMIAFQLTNRDYVKAQQIRTRVVRHLARLFEQVDLIVTPTTGCTAPVIRSDALRYGESDLPLLSKVMRFAFLANLTGSPAISFPAGHDAKGLPVGLQAIAPPWEEERLFRLAFAAEQTVERQPPKRHFPLLR
ncbi:MAG: amidase, partial [Deltaproteobacteria bacterium]